MEGQASIGEMIRFSWAKSREILFPFNFKRWLKILVLVWLAGVGIQGCNATFKVPSKPITPVFVPQKFAIPTLPTAMPLPEMEKMSPASLTKTPSTSGGPGSLAKQASGVPQKGATSLSISQDADLIAKLRTKMQRPRHKPSPVIFAALAVGMIVLGIGFTVLFLWLSSRFNFVFLDMLVTGEPAVRGPFKKHKETGNSYFVWMLVFFGMMLAAFLIAGAAGAGLLLIAKGHMGLSMSFGIFAGVLALIIILAFIVIGIMMHDFVLPVMYREKIPAMNAMKKFLKTGAFAFGKVFQYLLVILGLWILAAIFQSIVGILAAIGGLIAGGIVALPGIILIKALPFLKFPLMVLGGFVAIALVLAVITVIGMVMLPAVVFLRVFTLAYLTRLYPGCDLMGFVDKKS